MQKYKYVRVLWEDASGYDRSYEVDWLKYNAKPIDTSTVGHLIKSGRKTLIVAHQINEHDSAVNTTVIPKKYITKITYLEEK